MKKNFYLAIALLGFSVSLNAQTAKKGVGIKTDSPQATLDVRAEATVTTMPDGVLVPRLDVGQLDAKSAVYGADQNGALVFITSNTPGGAGTKVEKVKDPGFYYYDATNSKWKAVGGGDAGQISGALHANVPTNVRTLTSGNLSATTWTATDYGIILGAGFTGQISFPDPVTNSGRILFITNQTTGSKAWIPGGYSPNGVGVNLFGGRAIMVMSDGTKWVAIAGF